MDRIHGRCWSTLAVMASLAVAGPAVADGRTDAALVPLPSVLDFTRGGGFGVALGASVEYESAYDGADETEFEVEPAGAVHYRKGDHLFFWEGTELGWRGRLADVWLVQAGIRISTAILLESGLSFFGIGVVPPTPDWGLMIAEGRAFITMAPWISGVPGIALAVLLVGLTLLGDGLRDAFSPRSEGR